MTWDNYHSASERLAVEAEGAYRAQDYQRAEDLYREASAKEGQAFDELPVEKRRTRGITAVSVVALSYKGRDYKLAERLAYQYLSHGQLPPFAETQLRELLQVIWSAHAANGAGIRFVPGDVLVSVKGGDVLYGGAPLDLIIGKIECIQAFLFRTVEMLMQRPLRRRGGPAVEIQSMFRPWLFQAPAGSYQFAVRVEEPRQREIWERPDRPKVDHVTKTFFRVIQASSDDPEVELPAVVSDEEYRGAFLNLSRNLAPSGKTFERLEVHDASAPNEPVASFAAETRKRLNAALAKSKSTKILPTERPVETLRGVLRALHLDQDWFEITDLRGSHLRIDKAEETLDDVIGLMVNRRVIVTAARKGRKYLYQDVELDEE